MSFLLLPVFWLTLYIGNDTDTDIWLRDLTNTNIIDILLILILEGVQNRLNTLIITLMIAIFGIFTNFIYEYMILYIN